MLNAPQGEYQHLELHPPDVVVHVTSSDASSIGGVIAELRRRSLDGQYYLIVDFGRVKATQFSSKDRDNALKGLDPSWFLGGIYVNASRPMRMTIKIITLAMFLVGRADYPTEYVDSLEEAFDVVERFRKERAKAG